MPEQLDLFAEQDKKQAILELLEKRSPEFVTEARNLARHFCLDRERGMRLYGVPYTVTADDLWEYMDFERNCTGNNRIMGSVFRKGFVRIGNRQSRIKGHHAYEIKLWTIAEHVDEAKAAERENILK